MQAHTRAYTNTPWLPRRPFHIFLCASLDHNGRHSTTEPWRSSARAPNRPRISRRMRGRAAGGRQSHASTIIGSTGANKGKRKCVAMQLTRLDIHNRRAPVQGRRYQWRVYASSQGSHPSPSRSSSRRRAPGGGAAPLFDALVRATVGLCLHAVLRGGRLEQRLHALRRHEQTHRPVARCAAAHARGEPRRHWCVSPRGAVRRAYLPRAARRGRGSRAGPRRSCSRLRRHFRPARGRPMRRQHTNKHTHKQTNKNKQTSKPPRRHRFEARRKAPAHDPAHGGNGGAWARRVQRVKPAGARPAQ